MSPFRSLAFCAAICCTWVSVPVSARSVFNEASQDRAPAAVSEHAGAHGLSTLGQGSLSWFGIPIYDATLWSEHGNFNPWKFDQRLALRIDYHRNIKASRLAETTAREWDKLEGQIQLPGHERRNQWLSLVEGMWPDVAPGDFIMTLVEPDGPTRFYGQGGLLGVVEDPDFGPAFLSIWLHPDTSRPDLRASLIGASGSGG